MGSLLRHHAYLIAGVVIVGGKVTARNYRFTLIELHALCSAGGICGKLAFFTDYAPVKGIHRRNAFDARHLFLYCFKIICGEINLIFTVFIININTNQPSGHGIQFVVNLSLYSVTNGNNHDNRCNTDNNTEHRQNGPAFIAFDIHQGNFYIFPCLCHYCILLI